MDFGFRDVSVLYYYVLTNGLLDSKLLWLQTYGFFCKAFVQAGTSANGQDICCTHVTSRNRWGTNSEHSSTF